MRSYRHIMRSEPAANDQARVWVEVDDGEEVMVKVPRDASEDDIREVVERLLAPVEAPPVVVLDEAADLDAQIAALLARKAAIEAGG